MTIIKLTPDQKADVVEQLKGYFREEMDGDLGTFEAEFLLEFISKEIGPYFYNQGLYDAQAVVSKSIDNVVDAIYTIEQPTRSSR